MIEAHEDRAAGLADEEVATSEGAHIAGRDATEAAIAQGETLETPLREFLGDEEERGRGTSTRGSMSASKGGKMGQGRELAFEELKPLPTSTVSRSLKVKDLERDSNIGFADSLVEDTGVSFSPVHLIVVDPGSLPPPMQGGIQESSQGVEGELPISFADVLKHGKIWFTSS
ncbi:hypothetical protein Nepgr_013468 [Nepenthes gracilis]|uniref:Uncharacterized protein n=1 Tax=Nepenthes gracilis TaxID=150966 RepID=A0AAD3SJ76_NEPGR|nr:hypothetical protein Nepgr_013468 [Nepenthes gracilis]